MIRTSASAALMMVLAALPLRAEPPAGLMEAAESAAEICRQAGGEPVLLDGYRSETDLDGDGVPDYVTDLGRLDCVGAWEVFCTSTGCPVTVWLSQPDGSHASRLLGNATAIEIVERPDALPVLRLTYHASSCDSDVPSCSRSWVFENLDVAMPDFDPLPVPAPEVRAGAEPLPVAEEWTVRRVPGASPVALGVGAGNVTTLAAFCLQEVPFLSLSFLDPPADAVIEAAFGFAAGPVAVEARMEPTAGGAFVVALADPPLASRLGGADSETDLSVDGGPATTLSLRGSSRALRVALADCYPF
jgi:hypothetical protein